MDPVRSKSHVSLFLEANISIRIRSVFYSLPLLINWVIGVLFEHESFAQGSARRGFFLSMIFLFVNGVLFFLSGFVEFFAKEISDYVFFGLSTFVIVAYLIASFWISWKAWLQQDQSSTIIDQGSVFFEKILSR